MTLTTTAPNLDKLERVASMLKTISHPLRLGIVQLLDVHERLSVNEICESLACEQSLVSHHLSYMKLQGLLTSRREGKNIYYSLKLKQILQVIECVQNCPCDQD